MRFDSAVGCVTFSVEGPAVMTRQGRNPVTACFGGRFCDWACLH